MNHLANQIPHEYFVEYHNRFGYLIKEAISEEFRYDAANCKMTYENCINLMDFISEYIYEAFDKQALKELGIKYIQPFASIINENILISIQINTLEGKSLTLSYVIYCSLDNNLDNPYNC